MNGPTTPIVEVAASLPPSVVSFLRCASELSDTYNDGQGPEATAQRAERLGLAWISAWKGHWRVTLSEDGLAVRAHLLSTQVPGPISNERGDEM